MMPQSGPSVRVYGKIRNQVRMTRPREQWHGRTSGARGCTRVDGIGVGSDKVVYYIRPFVSGREIYMYTKKKNNNK